MREFLFLSAFVAAGLQFVASVQKLKGFQKVFPLGISLLLTMGMHVIIQNSGAGTGTFPFPSGFGLYLFLSMCTIGIAVGLISWFCWYVAFRKFIQTRRGLILSYVVFIVIHFTATIFLYWMTS